MELKSLVLPVLQLRAELSASSPTWAMAHSTLIAPLSGRLPSPAPPTSFFYSCKLKFLLGQKLYQFRESDEQHKIIGRSIWVQMGGSGHGQGQSGTFSSSGSELLCWLPSSQSHSPHPRLTTNSCSAAIKTLERLCRSKPWRHLAPVICAMPGLC